MNSHSDVGSPASVACGPPSSVSTAGTTSSLSRGIAACVSLLEPSVVEYASTSARPSARASGGAAAPAIPSVSSNRDATCSSCSGVNAPSTTIWNGLWTPSVIPALRSTSAPSWAWPPPGRSLAWASPGLSWTP